MSPVHPTVETILADAVEIASAEARQAFVDEACAGDDALRREVERLAACHFAAGGFLEPKTADGPTVMYSAIREAPGAQIGPYKLLEQIGEGGFGVVFMAEQTVPLRRRVALKILKPGMDTRQVIARFEAERQALALMDHPHIAKVLDAGATETGRPYFVMELVKGMPITRYCDEQRLPMRERLQLFIDVCGAIQHAHQKGIIHRDIKPNNVLVTLQDGRPLVKVIDFGVAKALGQQLTEKTVFTGFAQMVGTPLYMSPEQAALSNVDVDTRSDVYSLGVLLYELLTSSTPFTKESISNVSYDELRRIIREDDPPRPSIRISTLQSHASSTNTAHRVGDQQVLSRQLRGELDWIVMQALEKERGRRYESASAFAADVQRYLNDEPVQAYPPTALYRLRKIGRRHRGALTTAVLVVAALLVGTGVSVRYAMVAHQARNEAVGARGQAEEGRNLAERHAADARFQAEQARRFEAEAIQQRDRTAQALYNSDLRVAHADVNARQASRATDTLLRHVPYPGETDRRGWEWYYLLGQAHQSAQVVFAHINAVRQLDWSPDGSLVATVSSDGLARVWEASNWTLVRTFDAGVTIKDGVNWSPDSQQLAWGSCSDESALRVWNRRMDVVSVHKGHQESIWSVAWSHDGRRIASVGMLPDSVRIWNIDEGYSQRILPGAGRNTDTVSWSPDDRFLAATGQGPLYIWDTSTGDMVTAESLNRCYSSRWHPTQSLIAVGTNDGECLLWNHESRMVVRRWKAHAGEVSELAWRPDGSRIVTAGADGFVKVWNSTDGAELQSFSGHRGRVMSVAWGPEGRQLVSCGFDGTLRVWDQTAKPASTVIETHITGACALIWLNNETLRALPNNSHQAFDWNAVDGTLVRRHDLPNQDQGFRLWTDRLATLMLVESSRESQLGIWDVDHAREIHRLSIPGLNALPTGEAFHAAFSSDGNKLLIVPTSERSAVVIDLPTGVQHHTEPMLSYQVQAAWSPDGRFAASVGCGLSTDEGTPKYNGYVHLIDGRTGAYLRRFQIGGERLRATRLAWSPDSTRIAASNQDGLCNVIDVVSGNTLVSRRVHHTSVGWLEWSPDGRRVASGAQEGDVRIWDVNTGEELLTLASHNSPLRSVRWSPDGRKLATASIDGVIHVWNAIPGFRLLDSELWARLLDETETDLLDSLAQRADWQALARQCDRMLSRRPANPEAVAPATSFDNETLRYMSALMQVANGDSVAYRQQCRAIVQPAHTAVGPAYSTLFAWVCVLAPDALDDYSPALALAEQALAKDPGKQFFRTVRGGLLLRAGRFEESRQQLDAATKAEPDPTNSSAYASYLLAMAEHRLGHADPARQWLARGNQQMDAELTDPEVYRLWTRRLILQLLRAEATGLVDPAARMPALPGKLPGS